MTINYTTLLGLAKPVTGTESGAWGDVVNDQITSLVEDAIANAASISVTSGNVTLTDNNGTSDQARMAILLVTGSPGVSRNIVAPSTSKWYIVKNGSNAAVVLKGSATTGVTIPAGAEALAFWNGSDFELAAMIGPSTSTDNAVARFDGTTGKIVQNSAVIIDDSNNITGIVDETLSGNLNFTGSAKRITGDFSNATIANRVIFQSSTTNGQTSVSAIPNGSATGANLAVWNNPDTANGGVGILDINSSAVTISSTKTGTGTYLPLLLATGGSERMRIDTSGNINIPTLGARITGDFSNATVANRLAFQTSTVNGVTAIYALPNGTSNISTFQAINASDPTNSAWIRIFASSTDTRIDSGINGTGSYLPMTFFIGGSERIRIDTSGNVGIGTTSPQGILQVVGTGSSSASNWVYLLAGNVGAQNPAAVLAAGLAIGSNFSSGNSETNLVWGQTIGSGQYFSISKWTGSAVTEQMRITSGGEVYIAGTTDQGAYNLQVNGTGVWGAGAYVNGSDERLKDNIQTLSDGLSVVSQLRPVTFQYKPEHSKDQSVQPGFIAQELQQAMAGKDYLDGVVQSGPQYLNVAYQNLIPILTKAIQEAHGLIKTLEQRVAALEAK